MGQVTRLAVTTSAGSMAMIIAQAQGWYVAIHLVWKVEADAVTDEAAVRFLSQRDALAYNLTSSRSKSGVKGPSLV